MSVRRRTQPATDWKGHSCAQSTRGCISCIRTRTKDLKSTLAPLHETIQQGFSLRGGWWPNKYETQVMTSLCDRCVQQSAVEDKGELPSAGAQCHTISDFFSSLYHCSKVSHKKTITLLPTPSSLPLSFSHLFGLGLYFLMTHFTVLPVLYLFLLLDT